MAFRFNNQLLIGLLLLAPFLAVAAEDPPAASDTATTSDLTKEQQRLENASKVLSEIMDIPETSVPAALLRDAHAIAVIPKVIKAGLGFGGRFGKGVLSVRNKNNSWSDPAFVKITGGSWGLQIGISETDLILVFKSEKGVEGITSGKMTLGGDASVAAGPVGRNASAATDIKFQAEVMSYSRSRGLFAGIALEGAVISIDDVANANYYHRDYVSAGEILYGDMAAPSDAEKFVQTLSKYTPDLGAAQVAASTDTDSSGTAKTTSDETAETPAVKTYPVGANAAPEELAETDGD